MKPDGSQPDLIATYATNGRSGYVYADELDGYQRTSPTDALRWQEEHGDESRSVTVYESDGPTVVGEFVIEPGSGSPPPQDPRGRRARRDKRRPRPSSLLSPST